MHDRGDRYRLLMADVYELAGLSRRISGRDAARIGATGPQWQVLSVLDGGPATVPKLAQRLGMTRQGVQRVVNELMASGAARRHVDDGHLRSPRIELTSNGSRVLAALWEATAPHRERVLAQADIGADELDSARTTIRLVICALRTADARAPV